MPRINSPCFKCKERSTECHSSCTKYKEYKDQVSEINDAKISAHDYERDYLAYLGRRKLTYINTNLHKDKMKGR